MMRTSARAAMRLAGLAVCGVLTAGCQAHLYNQENDKQAALLKEKIAAVKFDEPIKAARDNHKAISEAIAVSLDRQLAADAKLLLLDQITSALSIEKGFAATIDKRLDDVVGPSAVTVLGFYGSLNRTTSSYEPNSPGNLAVRRRANILVRNGGPEPKICAVKLLDSGVPAKDINGNLMPDLPSQQDYESMLSEQRVAMKKAAAAAFMEYAFECTRLLQERYKLESEFENATGKQVNTALKNWQLAQKNFLSGQRLAESALKSYRALEKDYKNLLKERAGRRVDLDKKTDELFKKAADALEKASKINGIAGDHGLKLVAEERIAEIQEILSLLSGDENAVRPTDVETPTLDDDVRQHLLAVAKLPAIADQINTLLNSGETARLAPLRLELAYQKQVLVNAQRNIDLALADVEVRKNEYLTVLRSIERLLYARSNLATDVDRTKSIHAILGSASKSPDKLTKEQTNVLNALTAYYDSEARHGAAAKRVRFNQTAAAFQRNLDTDEMALAQWKTLVEGEAIILSDYHSAGIKPESLGGLLSAIMLGLVAYGVNQ